MARWLCPRSAIPSDWTEAAIEATIAMSCASSDSGIDPAGVEK
jgi:hypothetical protein